MLTFPTVTDDIKRRINHCQYRINLLQLELADAKTPDDMVYRIKLKKMINELEIQRDTFKFVIGEMGEEALLLN